MIEADKLALSVIVIGYEMARELPRTIKSLSPALQIDMAAEDYEILVVDNGSTTPPTDQDVRTWSPNARLLVMSDATCSPVPAINRALAEARGALVGVFIDGARMASPRLLAGAVEASRTHDRPVVGTLGFHLGPDVQMRSVKAGYDQTIEDRLLAASDWEGDPYRLFDIASLAASGAGGWFVTPSETNSLFLSRDHWHELGGYDERFVSPGGGLANLDIWERLCGDPDCAIILLLGEATFHQVHGGIATNSPCPPHDDFHAEYLSIRGKSYTVPTAAPQLFGRLHPAALGTMRKSVSFLMGSGASPQQHDQAALPIIHSDRLRDFDTALPGHLLNTIQQGVLNSVYRGVRCLKSPFDLALYQQLFSKILPQTVIEIGCHSGGSSLWFADLMAAHNVARPRVVTVDIEPRLAFSDERIQVIAGDAGNLAACLDDELLASCPRPWLVIEDSSHTYSTTINVLNFFDRYLHAGDYIVVEDGVVAHFSAPEYRQYENGPNRAVSDFLSAHRQNYTVDTDLCDFYGFNVTYNPNGWLRRL